MSSDVTSTETNSSDESKGRTYGLDGDLFVVAVVTLFVAITAFTLLFTIFAWGWFPAFIVVGLPAGLIFAWVFGLKQGRPAGYDLDWFEQLTMGTSWGYYHQFLNPSLPDRWEAVDNQAKTYEQLWDPEASIQELSYPSDNVSDSARPHGFYADGYYHALLAIKRWPHRTSNSNPPAIGLIHHLTGLPMLDYAVTLNARPLPIRAEINKSEKQLKRNTGDYADSARHELLTSARKMERKIERLSQGYTFPFESLMTINVWAKSYEELDQKLNAIKNAVNSMNGAQTYEPALAATTKKLWYQTWPGWAGTYTNYSLYSENNYLADLIPFSSSFTGFLDTAEALYDGTNGNLVGVCTFREGTPQHGVLLGMSGAGKSVFMEDLLSQTEPYYGYTVIIEEGNSHGVYAKTFSYKDRRGEIQWCKTINIKPDSNLTVNLFDTQGAPLNSGGVLAGAAGTFKKAKEGICLLSRSHPGGGGRGRPLRPRRPLRSRSPASKRLDGFEGLFGLLRRRALRS